MIKALPAGLPADQFQQLLDSSETTRISHWDGKVVGALLDGKEPVIHTIRRGPKEVKTFHRYVALIWADGVNVNEKMMGR